MIRFSFGWRLTQARLVFTPPRAPARLKKSNANLLFGRHRAWLPFFNLLNSGLVSHFREDATIRFARQFPWMPASFVSTAAWRQQMEKASFRFCCYFPEWCRALLGLPFRQGKTCLVGSLFSHCGIKWRPWKHHCQVWYPSGRGKRFCLVLVAFYQASHQGRKTWWASTRVALKAPKSVQQYCMWYASLAVGSCFGHVFFFCLFLGTPPFYRMTSGITSRQVVRNDMPAIHDEG